MSKQDIKLVREFNQWRRGDEEMLLGNSYPAQIGRALDNVVEMAERYEELRTHNELLIDAVKNLTDICITQIGADYNDAIHAAYLKGVEALFGDEK